MPGSIFSDSIVDPRSTTEYCLSLPYFFVFFHSPIEPTLAPGGRGEGRGTQKVSSGLRGSGSLPCLVTVRRIWDLVSGFPFHR
jgi:hypothetical protein